MEHGDFTQLAESYSRYRPGYSEQTLSEILELLGAPVEAVDFADLGAGTGIFTRMLAARGPRRAVAVEPNPAMRARGVRDSDGFEIEWREGSGEETGLPAQSFDLLSAASCFHWMDFGRATEEIARVLRPGGHFVALWNPRLLEANPLLVEIEALLYEMAPHIRRFSSGRSAFCEALAGRLVESRHFEAVTYREGRHTVKLTPEQYLGAWSSVNDVRVQAGESCFARFLERVGEKVEGLEAVEATYWTRAWVARKAQVR